MDKTDRLTGAWTVEAGRGLCYNGECLVNLTIVQDPTTGKRAINPADADDLTKDIAKLLNHAKYNPHSG